MIILKMGLPGVKLYTPDVYSDDRGYFSETFSGHYAFDAKQANMSKSKKGVIRGLHYQEPSVAKLVWVASGSIYDVIYDLRSGKSFGTELTDKAHNQLLCPAGYAHGFQALEDDTIVCYLMDGLYNPMADHATNPLDKGIAWPIKDFIISDKDKYAD